jgi:uncharacterized protein YkwD
MTRLGALLATVVTILACAILAVSADALSGPGRGPLATVAGRSASGKDARGPDPGCAPGWTAARRRHGGRASDCRKTSRRTVAHRVPATRPASRSKKAAAPPSEASETQAGTIAKVLATPCQNSQLIPEPGNLPLIRAAVLCLVNTERAENGRSPLAPNAQLEEAAESHGQEMISLDYFDHVSPSGLTPVGRIRDAGYIPNSEVGYVIGENLAWGTLTLATPQAILSAWIASPGHLANILEGTYLDTGISVVPEVPASLGEGAPGALYTQEFGVIVR